MDIRPSILAPWFDAVVSVLAMGLAVGINLVVYAWSVLYQICARYPRPLARALNADAVSPVSRTKQWARCA